MPWSDNTFNVGVLGSSPRRITDEIGIMSHIAETKTVSAIFVIPLSGRIVNIVRLPGVQFVAQAVMPVHLLKRWQINVKIQAYSLTSRKIKKLQSRTPLICERKIFTLELNASAEAFVARRRK